MERSSRDEEREEREERIHNQVIVDAYGPAEQAIGWYTYLEETLHFPFRAKCVTERLTSPLRPDDKVEVVEMAPVEECDHEMFVLTRWNRRNLAVPLSQLAGVGVDDETGQAIGDWHYWAKSGRQF